MNIKEQRPLIYRLADKLNVHSGHDDYGDPFITGHHGNIHVLSLVKETFNMYCYRETPLRWRNLRANAVNAGLVLIQDGDSEGCLSFAIDFVNSDHIVTFVRECIGVRKIPTYTDDYKQILRERLKRNTD